MLTVVNTLHEKRLSVVVETFHVEAFEVGVEGHFGVFVAFLVVLENGLAALAHVVSPSLLIDALAVLVPLVGGFDDKLGGVDVGKLGTVTVASTGRLLLVVVIVRRGEEVTEDEFWDPNAFLAMDLDGNTSAVVVHRDASLFAVNFDLENVHRLVVLLVIGGVDEDFVKDLVETWDEGALAQLHVACGLIKNPHKLCGGLSATDVGVWTLEHVFELGQLRVKRNVSLEASFGVVQSAL